MALVLTAIPGSRNGFDASFSFPICATDGSARRRLPGRLQQLHRLVGHRHAVHVVDVLHVRALRVPRHDRAVELDRRVVAPRGVGRVLEEDDRDRSRPPCCAALGREGHDVRGARDGVVDDQRPPAEPVRERRRPGSRTSASRRARARSRRTPSGSRSATRRRERSTSYGCAATIFTFERAMPCLRPASRSLP